MTQSTEKGLNSLNDYLSFIAKTLIQFISMLFYDPKMALKKPEHIYIIGHIVLLVGLLIPSRNPG
jgi:hypothetical protein